MKAVWIWGGGGHGRVVADLVQRCGNKMLGIVDLNRTGIELNWPGTAVVSESEFIEMLNRRLLDKSCVIALGIGGNRIRKRIAGLVGESLLFTAVHSGAYVSAAAQLGAGTIVLANASVGAGVRIGCACIINTGAIIEHDAIVGDGSHIAPGAAVLGSVAVGQLAFIGANATILPGITVGDEAIVGAGAVVVRDVARGQTVAGNPARVMK